MRTKEAKRWMIVLVTAIIKELGYACITVSMKCDGASELLAICREVTLLRESPTVPIDVPIKVSQSNGAIERTVRSWQGQFRAMKSQLEDEAGGAIEPKHPIWQ